MNIFGKGQGLDGDLTSTGAICIASHARGQVHDIPWLLEGDRTTPCPHCGAEGTIIEGESRWRQDGLSTAVDGSLVQCKCPLGSNYVIAPLHQGPAIRSSIPLQPSASTLGFESTPSPRQAVSTMTTFAQPRLEPGFHIVQHSQSFNQVLHGLADPQRHLAIRLQRLNPTFENGFKAGEIFVIGDPGSAQMCTREELHLMEAAELARDSLAGLSPDEADFMMRHQAEIAGLLSDVSLSMGVAQAMMARSFEDLKNTLHQVELLHQQQFSKHGHLKSPQFFASRKELFKRMEAQLRIAFLNKPMNLGSHDTLRRGLGISSRSLVHHWSKAGVPGQIPGYATHLEKVARMSTYLKTGGHIGVVIGADSSYFKIREACMAGETKACKKIRFTEAGSFLGGLSFGSLGGAAANRVFALGCLSLGPVSATVCSVAIVGAGALAGSLGGMSGGEWLGEVIYEHAQP
ncbi:PAAR domain-containing protein [Pseudomonas qingdaonensis]